MIDTGAALNVITKNETLESIKISIISHLNLLERYIKWKGNRISNFTDQTITIPARSQEIFYLRVNNSNIETESVPRFRVCDDVYLGDAVVTNRKGKAYI
ncbi:hypothetical protein ALC53_12821 [Atta colombica]|uniref:Uncharacterized protein n=1 Tax=Atta colombica TaxID=520822 RepID=A0A151HYQ4_9HYME|nr:hypothetical protein ALC53_12821 [Atta colombica]